MAKITRTFTPVELEDLGVPYNLPEGALISRTFVERRRWSLHWELLFRHQGQVWQVEYQAPATEHQECDTWFDEETVTATAMQEQQVTVTKWVPVTIPSPRVDGPSAAQ